MDEICYLVSGKFATKEFMVLVPVKKADIDEVEFFGILKKYICKKLEKPDDENVIEIPVLFIIKGELLPLLQVDFLLSVVKKEPFGSLFFIFFRSSIKIFRNFIKSFIINWCMNCFK